MAAIVPNVERTRDPEEQIDAAEEAHASAPLSGQVGAFGIMQEVPVLQSSHAELTRTVWIRRTLEDALKDQKYWLEQRNAAEEVEVEEAAEALAGLDDAEEYVGEVEHGVEVVAGDRLPTGAVSGLGALPPGVKVRKGPDHDYNGAWHLTYAGVVCSFGFSPELPRGWCMNRPHPWTGPKDDFGADLIRTPGRGSMPNNKAEAILAIKAQIDAHDPWIQPYLRPAGTALDGFGKPSGDDGRDKSGEWRFRLTPGIPADVIPWYIGAIPLVDSCSLFGSNGKMKCPTWDLPAGAPHTGGTCPGAIGAQSVVEPQERLRVLKQEGGRFYLPVLQPGGGRVEVEENRAICQMCYALEGNYPSPHVQIGEMVRYWWTRDMLSSGRTEEWIATMVSAILALKIEESHGIEPIRVHSAGDFFSVAYAKAWMQVANKVAEKRSKIRFWAPTRTWAVGWNWEAILALNTAGNFIVRPSSYGVGDVAPGELAPGRGAGSTSILNPDNLGMTSEREAKIVAGRRKQYEHNRQTSGLPGPDRRYDWDCQTYAVALSGRGDLSKSCADAVGPDGGQGCRACWTHPNLRINYTTH